MRHKVLVVLGTRPEAIKLAPVVAALRASDSLQPRVCVTGQHREMVAPLLATFGIHPDHNLEVMEPRQELADLTARLLPKISAVLIHERPAAVLVQGDTTSSFVSALASYYQRLPVGHVEAGLRTGSSYDPFPEEINRRLISHVAHWHFAPTPSAQANLLREGIAADGIYVTGNTAVDCLIHTVERLRAAPPPALEWLPAFAGRKLVLVTGHRRESFGAALRNICNAIRTVADRHEEVLVVYPIHLNPAVQAPVRAILADHSRIVLTEPLDYLTFVELMRSAYLVLTDSGGIQEEAPSLRIPVLVMRNTTERPEGVEAGVARLVGTTAEGIAAAAEELLTDTAVYARMRAAENPYGDGQAARRIVGVLEAALA